MAEDVRFRLLGKRIVKQVMISLTACFFFAAKLTLIVIILLAHKNTRRKGDDKNAEMW